MADNGAVLGVVDHIVGNDRRAGAFDDGVDLVEAGMRVQAMLLAGLEGVEANQQPLRLEIRGWSSTTARAPTAGPC